LCALVVVIPGEMATTSAHKSSVAARGQDGAMTDEPALRMLLVHAHPDDETLGNGATMAKYAAAGAGVNLVTCTRGEEGLVLVPELEHLAAHRDDRLGAHRETELAKAMAALGVRDHRFLDTVALSGDERPAHYRDSGMAWDAEHRAVAAPDTGPDAFARVEVDEAAARLAAVVREVRPHVVVTYEPGGGYGHPDHVQAHRVAMRGVELAAAEGPGGPPWTVPKVYWNVLPEGLIRAALRELASSEAAPRGWSPDGPLPPMVVPDEDVTTAIDAQEFVGHKRAALEAHATQVAVEGDTVLVGDGARQPVVGIEFYRLVAGTPGGPRDTDGRETDLFAGVA
jgi:N-acetyl-1-D-myo-inositol-2-amino-2-deoxy-alpha-D-glucopyranoside deacetylase